MTTCLVFPLPKNMAALMCLLTWRLSTSICVRCTPAAERMILGSDSHTRYGALGTMAIGEGGGELAKQLLGRTYDVARPGVVAVYLTGKPAVGVGPPGRGAGHHGAVFKTGYVKNKVDGICGPRHC